MRLLFLFFSNTNIQFRVDKLTKKFYIIVDALPTTNRVDLINKRKFVKAVLDKIPEIFLIYIAALKANMVAKITIHLS